MNIERTVFLETTSSSLLSVHIHPLHISHFQRPLTLSFHSHPHHSLIPFPTNTSFAFMRNAVINMVIPTALILILAGMQLIRLHNQTVDRGRTSNQLRLLHSRKLLKAFILRITLSSSLSHPTVRIPEVLPGQINRSRGLHRRLPRQHADALQHPIADEIAHVVHVVVRC